MTRALFIAGTDTGIGKTHSACALLHAIRSTGRSACGMKPIASGCDETPEGLRNEDALALQAASSTPPPSYGRYQSRRFARTAFAASGRMRTKG
jgi:dethiobiotin synthetase